MSYFLRLLCVIAFTVFYGVAAKAQPTPNAGTWVRDLVNFGGCTTVSSNGVCFLAFGGASYTPSSGFSAPIGVRDEKAMLCLNEDTAGAASGGSILAIYKTVDANTVNGGTLLPNSALPYTDSSGAITNCYVLTRGYYLVQFQIGSGSEISTVRVEGY